MRSFLLYNNKSVCCFFCIILVDASAAGEGQLEISINEGEVPNHVQVVGGGRCLVSFTPEQAKSHYIDIKFNGETVSGCPFVCAVADTSRVLLNLSNLGELNKYIKNSLITIIIRIFLKINFVVQN